MTEKTITQLLDEREKTFLAITEQLMDRITPNVIAAVEERLTLQKKFGRGQIIKWQQMVYVPSVKMLVVLATLELPVGFKTILESGDEFEVTEENAGYFNYPIRVGVPMELAETGTKEQLLEYLDRQERELEEAAEKVLEDAVEAIKDTDPTDLEFDTSILSDEQKKLFINMPPGSKPN